MYMLFWFSTETFQEYRITTQFSRNFIRKIDNTCCGCLQKKRIKINSEVRLNFFELWKLILRLIMDFLLKFSRKHRTLFGNQQKNLQRHTHGYVLTAYINISITKCCISLVFQKLTYGQWFAIPVNQNQHNAIAKVAFPLQKKPLK